MPSNDPMIDVLIIGTGVSGLVAARELQRAGRRVLLMDKSKGLGGRLASRRIGDASFDHGAQFITTRDARFAEILRGAAKAGDVTEWCQGFGASTDGHTRWRGKPAMTAFAKHLAKDLAIRTETHVSAVKQADSGYTIETSTGTSYSAAAVLLTPPVPQSLALLEAGGIHLERSMQERLSAIEYERCIAVMAVLKQPSLISPPGAVLPTSGPVSWIADNQLKGISVDPAVTIQANPEFSLSHWDEDRMLSGRKLIDACQEWIGGEVLTYQVHGWRYSKPMKVEEHPCALLRCTPPLVMAGDAFAGPRVEGAALSGFAATETILTHLSR